MTENKKLVCPFCSSELSENTLHVPNGLECLNPECQYCERIYEEEIWQALIDGKRAQDALKVAVDILKLVGYGKADEQGICRFIDETHCENVRTICRNALITITSIIRQGE